MHEHSDGVTVAELAIDSTARTTEDEERIANIVSIRAAIKQMNVVVEAQPEEETRYSFIMQDELYSVSAIVVNGKLSLSVPAGQCSCPGCQLSTTCIKNQSETLLTPEDVLECFVEYKCPYLLEGCVQLTAAAYGLKKPVSSQEIYNRNRYTLASSLGALCDHCIVVGHNLAARLRLIMPGLSKLPTTLVESKLEWKSQIKLGCPTREQRVNTWLNGFSGLESGWFSEVLLAYKMIRHRGCEDGRCAAESGAKGALHVCEDRTKCYETVVPIAPTGKQLVKVGAEWKTIVDTGNVPYLAISHVWGQGWFGGEERKISSCIMKLLETVIQELNIGYLWIDAYCVPEGEGKENLRMEEMKRMATVYGNAVCTLVLDVDLYLHGTLAAIQCPPPGRALHGPLRVISCDWFSRLWTLQEALLTSNLRFMVRGAGSASVRCESWEELKRNWAVYAGSTADIIIMQRLVSMGTGVHDLPIDEAVVMAAGRTTSHPEDGWRAIAGLCGLPELVRNDPLLRTAPLSTLKKGPYGLLTTNHERSQTLGCCWMPVSPLGPLGTACTQLGSGKVDEGGWLNVECSGSISIRELDIEEDMYDADEGCHWLFGEEAVYKSKMAYDEIINAEACFLSAGGTLRAYGFVAVATRNAGTQGNGIELHYMGYFHRMDTTGTQNIPGTPCNVRVGGRSC